MNIDRSRFLLLTAALAATGCTINNTTLPADGSVQDTGTAGDTLSGDTRTDTSVTEGGDAGDAGADATDGAVCDDTVGTPRACSDIKGTACGPTDAGAAGIGPTCEGYLSSFKPRVAKATIDCLIALPTCEGDTAHCATDALAAACPDPAAKTYCDALLAACAPDGGLTDAGAGLSLADCVQYANGMTSAGRSALQLCVVHEGACSVPFKDCAGR